MSWLNLLTPTAAVLAVFLAAAALLQSIRNSRALRSIHDRLADAGFAAKEVEVAALKKIGDVPTATAAAAASSGEDRPQREPRPKSSPLRTSWIVGAIIIVGLIAVGWILFGGNSSSSGSTAAAPATNTTTTPGLGTGTTPPTHPVVVTACSHVTPVASPSSVTVSVYNGSGVAGAAGQIVSPKLSSVGYAIGVIANAQETQPLTTTAIQYAKARDANAACNVAAVLGVKGSHVVLMTPAQRTQAGTSNVAVLVGTDIAH